MLIGFNNDVEFGDRMFHIQTEDNGVKNASITTILFFQGQILDTKNSGYEDLIEQFGEDEEELKKNVKQRMVGLHRTLYKNLFDGTYVDETERILRGKAAKKAGQNPSSASLTGLKKMPSPGAAARRPRTRSQMVAPVNASISRPHTGQPSVRPERPQPERAIQWSATGHEGFTGIIWPAQDFRIDGLVAEFLDSLG